MTLIVGILCRDGVVMASDSAATFGNSGVYTIGQQEVQKVQQLNDSILYASTGAVGMSQLICNTLKSLWSAKGLSGKNPDEVMDVIGKSIQQLVMPYLQSGNLLRGLTGDASMSLCKSLVALPAGSKPMLYQFDYNGAPERATKDLPFVALGSGQPIADPFLALLKRLLWTDSEPTIAEGKLAAVWTINHVCVTNPGGVGGRIQLATLSASKGTLTTALLSPGDVNEHLQRVASAEGRLVKEVRGEVDATPSPPSAAGVTATGTGAVTPPSGVPLAAASPDSPANA